MRKPDIIFLLKIFFIIIFSSPTLACFQREIKLIEPSTMTALSRQTSGRFAAEFRGESGAVYLYHELTNPTTTPTLFYPVGKVIGVSDPTNKNISVPYEVFNGSNLVLSTVQGCNNKNGDRSTNRKTNQVSNLAKGQCFNLELRPGFGYEDNNENLVEVTNNIPMYGLVSTGTGSTKYEILTGRNGESPSSEPTGRSPIWLDITRKKKIYPMRIPKKIFSEFSAPLIITESFENNSLTPLNCEKTWGTVEYFYVDEEGQVFFRCKKFTSIHVGRINTSSCRGRKLPDIDEINFHSEAGS